MEAPDTPEDLKRKIQGVVSIEQLGGRPVVMTADTADQAAMKRLFSTVQVQYGPVRGIVHAAGLAGTGWFRASHAIRRWPFCLRRFKGRYGFAHACPRPI